MERNKRRKYSDDVAPAIREQRDSPTIENLIEKLNQDLEDTTRNASNAEQSTKAAW